LTVEGDQPPKPVDPQASLRAELLAQLGGAQLELQKIVAELARSGLNTALGDNQLQALAQLQRAVGVADLKTLVSLRSEIGAAIVASQAAAQQGSSEADNAAANSPAAAARQTITNLTHDYYDRKVLDPYLKFQSEEDEAAYRKREQENQEAIKRELAKGTLQGDHNAALLFERQLNDAGAHGADASPDFAEMKRQNQQAIRDTGANLEQPQTKTAQPNIVPPPVPDSELADVRAALKSAGVTALAENNSNPSAAGTPRINRETVTPARS